MSLKQKCSEARIEAPMATLSIPHYSDETSTQGGESRSSRSWMVMVKMEMITILQPSIFSYDLCLTEQLKSSQGIIYDFPEKET